MNDTPDIRWSKILAEYLGEYSVELPLNPKVLNVGCGRNVVWNFLGTVSFSLQSGLGLPRYLGVDIDKECLIKAKRQLGDSVNLIAADARHMSYLLRTSFQLVIFEHPDFSTSRERPKVWRAIFKETFRILDNNGAVILTSFWVNDHIPAQMALERANFRILYSGSNCFPGKEFDKSDRGEPLVYDKYILIAQKVK